MIASTTTTTTTTTQSTSTAVQTTATEKGDTTSSIASQSEANTETNREITTTSEGKVGVSKSTTPVITSESQTHFVYFSPGFASSLFYISPDGAMYFLFSPGGVSLISFTSFSPARRRLHDRPFS